ncbi:hypothetical protein Tco_1196393 [Tanacetum coccineum]
MSAKDKNGLGYGTQLDEMSNKSETDSEISMSVFEVRSSDEEITPANDRFSKADGYHVIPPPITGKFLNQRSDISFASLDEYAIRKKIIESKTTELNTDTSKSKTSETVGKTNEVNNEKPKSIHESLVSKPTINKDKVIIEDWYSDDEDDVSAVKTSTDHLIKDCDFYAKKSPEPKLKTVVNTGVLTRIGLVNLVRPNGKRAVHTVSTARPISTVRPVSTARPFAPKIAQTGSAIRPIYPRMDDMCVPDISLKDKNKAKPDKTEHEIGKSAKNQGQRVEIYEIGLQGRIKGHDSSWFPLTTKAQQTQEREGKRLHHYIKKRKRTEIKELTRSSVV